MSTSEIIPIAPTQLGNEARVHESFETDASKATSEKAETAQVNPLPKEKQEELQKEDVEKISEFLNDSTRLFDVSLTFKVNNEANRIVVSVVNKDTDEVVRQIPPQEILDIAERLHEMVGVLFNESA